MATFMAWMVVSGMGFPFPSKKSRLAWIDCFIVKF
jgi:hypothetical protein